MDGVIYAEETVGGPGGPENETEPDGDDQNGMFITCSTSSPPQRISKMALPGMEPGDTL